MAKETMDGLTERKNKNGEPIGLQLRITVGSKGGYIWLTKSVRYNPELKPLQAKIEARTILDHWANEERKEYEKYLELCASGQLPVDEYKDYRVYRANREQRQQSQAEDKANRNVTFEAFVKEHWLSDHVHDGQHKPSTISEYEYNAGRLIDYFGSMQMNAIRAENIKRYINKLQREKSEDGTKLLSDSTKFQRFKALRNILRYAYQMDYITSNPLDKVPSAQLSHKPHPKLREGKDFMNREQVRQYIQCLNEEPLFYRTMVNLIIFTGLRRGEVVGLQWGDIDLEQRTLQVIRNVIRDTKSESGIYIGTPKTEDGARTIALSSYLVGLLKSWKEEQVTRRGVLLPTAYVFSNAEDPYWPLYPTTVTAWVHDFEVKRALPKVSPHDLRHTAATLALQSGANLKTVQDMLGHADFKTTATYYTGITEETRHETAAAVEALVFEA
jgi:integrase